MKIQPVPAGWLAALIATLLLAGTIPASPASAESGDEPATQYASLPDTGRSRDADITGSLPDPAAAAHSLPTFDDHVDDGSIILRASAPTRCLPDDLREIVAEVAAKFGSVSVESTHRSRNHNRRAGGAHRSLHLSCRAVDFRVRTRARDVMAYLRSRPEIGGLKIYRNGIIHIDDGEHRNW